MFDNIMTNFVSYGRLNLLFSSSHSLRATLLWKTSEIYHKQFKAALPIFKKALQALPTVNSDFKSSHIFRAVDQHPQQIIMINNNSPLLSSSGKLWGS